VVTINQCIEKGVTAAVIISAGFAEIGEEGDQLQNKLVRIAQEGGLRFVGPNCIGHANVHEQLMSAGFGHWFKAGSVALLAQSGNIASRIAKTALQHNIGFSKFVGTGNEADLHTEDFLEYLSTDEETRLIAVYVEGLKEGRRFLRLAKEITLTKPIVMMKAGGTQGAARAAKSHTGALAGSETVYKGAFKQAGVIRVDNEDELCDVIEALQTQPLPRGNRVGLLTMGGGPGVVATEACEKAGLEIASLEPTTLETLNAILPPRWSHGNPVDMVGIKPLAGDETIMGCLKALFSDPNVDAILTLVTPVETGLAALGPLGADQLRNLDAQHKNHINRLNQWAHKHKKPLFFIGKLPQLPGDPQLPTDQKKIPYFPGVHRAASVLRRLFWYQRYLQDHNAGK